MSELTPLTPEQQVDMDKIANEMRGCLAPYIGERMAPDTIIGMQHELKLVLCRLQERCYDDVQVEFDKWVSITADPEKHAINIEVKDLEHAPDWIFNLMKLLSAKLDE